MSTARLSPADRGVLVDEPWLEAFLEDGDRGLDGARTRYRRATAAARAELRARGTRLYTRMRTAAGHETTALETHPKDGS
jgi:hypothetical protein